LRIIAIKVTVTVRTLFENLVKNKKKLWWSTGGILVEVSEKVPEQFRLKIMFEENVFIL
jgi:hypothetical protein